MKTKKKYRNMKNFRLKSEIFRKSINKKSDDYDEKL